MLRCFKECFCAAILTIKVTGQHGKKLHVLLPVCSISIEEWIISIQVDGRSCKITVTTELLLYKGLKVITSGTTYIITVIIPDKDSSSSQQYKADQ